MDLLRERRRGWIWDEAHLLYDAAKLLAVRVRSGVVASAKEHDAAWLDQLNVVAEALHCFRTVDTQRYLHKIIIIIIIIIIFLSFFYCDKHKTNARSFLFFFLQF